MYQCHFCTSERPGRVVVAREMMFGLRDEFEYVECSDCGSLQIKQIPADLSRYYPEGYYSFGLHRDPLLKRWMKRLRFKAAWGRRSLVGRLLLKAWGPPALVSWLKPTGVGFDDAILDVGSGSGDLLLQMNDVGFTNLTGIDPYVKQGLTLGPNVRILKMELEGASGPYDLILFNHSLEHVPDPEHALRKASELLDKGRYVIVRLPVAGNYAWREYGTDWVQLDAPRHLHVPSEKGMRALATRTGYDVEAVLYESTRFQFWASEQYRRDIPLRDERSYRQNPNDSLFNTQHMRAFAERAHQLNQVGDGDEACFFLRRI